MLNYEERQSVTCEGTKYRPHVPITYLKCLAAHIGIPEDTCSGCQECPLCEKLSEHSNPEVYGACLARGW